MPGAAVEHVSTAVRDAPLLASCSACRALTGVGGAALRVQTRKFQVLAVGGVFASATCNN
jgi:hypothetical protein